MAQACMAMMQLDLFPFKNSIKISYHNILHVTDVYRDYVFKWEKWRKWLEAIIKVGLMHRIQSVTLFIQAIFQL